MRNFISAKKYPSLKRQVLPNTLQLKQLLMQANPHLCPHHLFHKPRKQGKIHCISINVDSLSVEATKNQTPKVQVKEIYTSLSKPEVLTIFFPLTKAVGKAFYQQTNSCDAVIN